MIGYDFKNKVHSVIDAEKKSRPYENRYYSSYDDGVYITPITIDMVDDDLVELLKKWREENQSGFLKIFNVTFDSTKKWIKKNVQNRGDRLMFLIVDSNNEVIGHLGVSTFDYDKRTCEIDNVVRGKVSHQLGIMLSASNTLISWIKAHIEPEEIRLRVLSDNISAIYLYHKLGFVPDKLEPLEKFHVQDNVEWRPIGNGKVDKFFMSMKLGIG